MVEPVLLRSPLLNHGLGTPKNDFVIQESIAEPGPPGHPHKGVPLHLHRSEDEAWYVLEGTLRFQYGTREIDAGAGSGILLPRGTPHTFWNPGAEPARYLLIAGPKTAGLLEVLHGSDRPPQDTLRDLYAKYDVEYLE
jgi:mannose-6-phosphate isomerase-like protein (cupin superfamily)